MANTGVQNFANPLDPASILAQQQLARQQSYVDSLRQQSLDPVPQDPKGLYSPWAGLAQGIRQIGSAFGQASVDKKNMAMAAQLRQAQADRFGVGGQPSAHSPSAHSPYESRGIPQGAPASAPVPPAPQSPMPNIAPSGAGTPVAPMASPAPPTPPAGPAAAYGNVVRPPMAEAPPLTPQQAQSPANPNVLPGYSPQQSYELSITDPESYSKLKVAAGTQTDAVKNLMAAGLQPGSDGFNSAMAAINRKAGFVDATNIREGGAAMLNDGSGRIVTAPKTEVGMQNMRGPDGTVIGQENVPGALAAIQASEQARQTGKSAGSAPYELVNSYDPATGTPTAIPKSAIPGIGGQGGGLNGRFGNGGPVGVPTGPSIGATSFANTMGDAGGKYFSGLAESAADAPNRVYALQQMLPLVNGKTAFGPGTDTAMQLAGILNGVGKSFGYQGSFNNQNITNINEFNKWASQYSARAAQDLGLGGSDARLAMSVSATPNGHMTNDALRAVIPQLMGFEAAKGGMATAGARFAQEHPGPQAQGQFLTKWRAAYEPRVYQMMAMTPADAAAAWKRLPPPERAKLTRSSNALSAMGAM